MNGSVRKEGSTWYYVIELGKDESGRRKQHKKRGFRSKKEAQQALSKEIAERVNGAYVQPSKTLYRQFLLDWLKHKKADISYQTYNSYQSYIDNHISPILGHHKLSDINVMNINNFLTSLNQKGLADATIKRIFNIVNTSLNTAERWELIQRNPAQKVDKPKVKRRERPVWDENQSNHFLTIAKEHRYYIVFHLALLTGMRQGEILGLRWKDINLERKELSIRQTLSHDGNKFIEGAKTSSGVRTIALDCETIKELKLHRKMLLEEKVGSGGDYIDKDLVVCTPNGVQLLPRSLHKVWVRLIEVAGLPRIHFHDLRHTHASLLLKQGVHIKVVSERLGHSSSTITLDTYSHLLPNMQKEAAESLENLLFGKEMNG